VDIPRVMIFALDDVPPRLELFINSLAEEAIHSQFFQFRESSTFSFLMDLF